MKLVKTLILAVLVAFAPLSALASDTIHTMKMEGEMQVSVFLGLDDPYPLMTVEDFCALPINSQNIENCSAEAWIKNGIEFSFKT